MKMPVSFIVKHYNYQKTLKKIWVKTVELYQTGQRGSATYFSPEETDWLAANGITPQELYDFAEDYTRGGEPDFTTFAMITDVRRSHFLNKLRGETPTHQRDSATYPSKEAEVEGIAWLPRLIEKAKDKLAGTLNDNTMYGCRGDRRFFSTHDIHPAEFLRKVGESQGDDQSIIDWVKSRSRNE